MPFKITINKFYGGIADDLTAGTSAEYANALMLDDFMENGRLSPYRSYVSDTSLATNIRRILIGSDTSIYAMGESSLVARSTLYKKEADPTLAGWTFIRTGGLGASTAEGFAQGGKSLFFWSGTHLDRYEIAEEVYTDQFQTPAGLVAPGPIYTHSNGTTYFAYDNKIASWDLTTFTAIALDLPSMYTITDLTEWNNYLVITARFAVDPANSRVFFWDTINTSTYNFSKKIPEGVAYIGKNIGDEVAVIAVNGNTTLVRDATLFAYTYNGGQFVLRKKLIARENTTIEEISAAGDPVAVVKNNQLYFAAEMGGVIGIWRFGINNGTYCLKRDRFATNDNTCLLYTSPSPRD